MRSTGLLALLLLVAAALLAAILAVDRPAPAGVTLNPAPAPAAPALPPAPTITPRPATEPGPWAGVPFHWSQIESSDYEEYIANLRAIDCPQPVLQDIILADITKLYEAREAPFKSQLASLQAGQGNDPSTQPGNTKAEFALRKQLREVEKEKQTIVKQLLGIDLHLPPIRAWHPRTYDRYEDALHTVPSAKRDFVRQVQENYWEVSDQLNDKYGLRRTPEYLEEYQRINRERKAQLAQGLTAQELDDFEMRTTGIATRLGTHLSGLAVSPDEFREIFQVKNAVEAPYGGSVRVDMTEAGVTPEFEQKREAAEQKVAAILGPERYREYQLAQDPGFQTLAEVGERFGIAREKLIRAHEARQQAGPVNMDPLMARRYGLQLQPNPQAQNAQAALKELLGDAALTALQRGPNLQQIERSLPP